jgi:hypothetical protein
MKSPQRELVQSEDVDRRISPALESGARIPIQRNRGYVAHENSFMNTYQLSPSMYTEVIRTPLQKSGEV